MKKFNKLGRLALFVVLAVALSITACKNGNPISIVPIPVAGVKLDKTISIEATTVEVGKTIKLTATILPENATNKTIAWTTSDDKIATVTKKGEVKGVKAGTATITATTKDGSKKATCTVTVKDTPTPPTSVAVTELKLDKTATVEVGKIIKLTATILPENATNKTIAWTTSDDKIATVTEKGEIKGVKAGTATITATTKDGSKKATCTVTVKDTSTPPTSVAVTGVTLNKTAIVEIEKTIKLTATILPENATNKDITWESDKAEIATVDTSGVVKGLEEGTVTIMVKTKDGSKTATCTVTVYQSTTVSELEETLKKLDTINIHYIYISDLSNDDLYSESSGYPSKIASILKNYNNKKIYIIIPKSVFSIDRYSFTACGGLIGVTIPKTVISISPSAFSGCSGLTEINVDSGNTSYLSENGVLFSKNKKILIKYPQSKTSTNYNIPTGITSIGMDAFSGCSKLTNITIPDGVTSIERETFNGCSGLTSISIPDGVTSIGSGAFKHCSGLTSINIPDGVKSIERETFNGCKSLTSISIPDGVTAIGMESFYDCKKLTSITIPEGVTSIGYRAFYNCFGLTSISIPDGVTSIGMGTFYYCKKLTSITIPEGVTSIGSTAFYNCDELSNITIPEGITSIGNYAFYNCKKLTSITIPSTVTSIRDEAFSSCNNASIKIPNVKAENITFKDRAFGKKTDYNNTSVKKVLIPKGENYNALKKKVENSGFPTDKIEEYTP